MRRGFLRKASAVACVVSGLAGIAGDLSLSGQTHSVNASPFEPGAGTHETRAQSQALFQFPNASEVAPKNEVVLPPSPTRSSFMATWPSVSGAKGYLLDVSTSRSFNSFVDGYHDLDVGDVTGRVVTGLSWGTTYYYRVRPYDQIGPDRYSQTTAAATEATTGLVIHATFDSSITGNPNSAAIQATINRAISIYESLFTDPITIEIRFRYSTTGPNGDPLPAGRIAQSDFVYYTIAWSTVHRCITSGRKNWERQYRDCEPARVSVIYEYSTGQCGRAGCGFGYAAWDVCRRDSRERRPVRWNRNA